MREPKNYETLKDAHGHATRAMTEAAPQSAQKIDNEPEPNRPKRNRPPVKLPYSIEASPRQGPEEIDRRLELKLEIGIEAKHDAFAEARYRDNLLLVDAKKKEAVEKIAKTAARLSEPHQAPEKKPETQQDDSAERSEFKPGTEITDEKAAKIARINAQSDAIEKGLEAKQQTRPKGRGGRD